MSYATQAALSHDSDLIQRVAACAATQHIDSPETWAWSNSWKLSASPGWDAAYAYALNSSVDRPGNSESVLTDSMILSAVQSLIDAEKNRQPPI